jgi:type III pantothenate kinase
MRLMIDVGNTNVVIGLFREQKLTHSWRLGTNNSKTEDEIWVAINTLFDIAGQKIRDIKGVGLSSVVPEMTLTFRRLIDKYLHQEPLIVDAALDLGMEIKYLDPNAVGADRICNTVAGKKRYGQPLIVLDFGTATTFDCIDANGDYIGGIICPGIESAATVLHHKAAKLPKIELRFPAQLIGRNTEESMQSGIMFGSVEMINGLIRMLKEELGTATLVIATGGLAGMIAARTGHIDHIEPDLNLEGINLIYQRNRG